jgi:hypothetical protein
MTKTFTYFKRLNLSVGSTSAATEQTMLIPDLLPLGETGMLLGESGVGKTQTALDMGVSIAIGAPFLGREVGAPRPVLYLGMEGSDQSFQKRINALVARKAISQGRIEQDLLRTNLQVLTPAGQGFTNPEQLLLEIQEHISAMIQEGTPPALVVLDTLAALAIGDENAVHSTRHLWAFANEVASEANATVLVIHHFGKPNLQPGLPARSLLHSSRGSSANTASARFTLSLTNKRRVGVALPFLPGGDPPSKRDVLELQVLQNNDGPDGFSLTLERDPSTGILDLLEVQAEEPGRKSVRERPAKKRKQDEVLRIYQDPVLSEQQRLEQALPHFQDSDDPKASLRSVLRHLRHRGLLA